MARTPAPRTLWKPRRAALPLPLLAVLLLPASAIAAEVPVENANSLRTAIEAAQAGDEIVLADGVYLLNDDLDCATAGTAVAPIVVQAANPQGAEIRFNALEGFRVLAPHWHFEDLLVRGVCALDASCEHAFHLAGNADGTVIRGNHLLDFNAQIKSNGLSAAFPDDVLIESNLLADSGPRDVAAPVTKIDVVGGRRWIIRGNTIANFHKNGGNLIAYGAFLKGGSRDGLIERNLVVCDETDILGTTIGLSLGGGGTSPDSICEDSECTPEHIGGTLRNNIIAHCSDVGIYLNSAESSAVLHNTLYATAGLDLRFPGSTGSVRNNLLQGQIHLRDGATATESSNLEDVSTVQFAAWFADPAAADFRAAPGADLSALVDAGTITSVTDDFCGNPRDAVADIGAVEYSAGECLTTTGGGSGLGVFADGFEQPQGSRHP